MKSFLKFVSKYLKFRFIIPVVILLTTLFTFTDVLLVKNGKSPFFVMPTAYYQDGGSVRLSGLGYTIKKYHEVYIIDPKGINEAHVYKGYSFNHWFLPFSGSKVHSEKL